MAHYLKSTHNDYHISIGNLKVLLFFILHSLFFSDSIPLEKSFFGNHDIDAVSTSLANFCNRDTDAVS